MNLLKLIFSFKFVSTIFGAVSINLFDRIVPNILQRIYLHGRFNDAARSALAEKFEVPKRWFKHFYAFAAPYSTFFLILLCYRCLLNGKIPNIITAQLNFLLGSQHETPIPVEHTLLVMFIYTVHCWKRFYESHFISVFSDSTMSLTIYLIGFSHYIGGVISIVGETQHFYSDSRIILNWAKLTWLEYTCAFIFILSTYMQYRTNIILSKLRKNDKGVVVTKQHKVPKGELFEYVTAPLQLTEIILYLCMSIILRDGSTFHYVTLWTIANQVECAVLAHNWALKKLENYPKSRKIIVPFIF